MNINALKLRYTGQFLQAVIFHKSGGYITSCNSLTDTQHWVGTNLYDTFPLLGSMQETIQRHESSGKPITLPMVEMAIEKINGVFDFDIFVHPQNPDLRVWMIMNSTTVYKYLQEIQQERNVLRMEIEDLKNGRQIPRR